VRSVLVGGSLLLLVLLPRKEVTGGCENSPRRESWGGRLLEVLPKACAGAGGARGRVLLWKPVLGGGSASPFWPIESNGTKEHGNSTGTTSCLRVVQLTANCALKQAAQEPQMVVVVVV
jgi:hypothetical protein